MARPSHLVGSSGRIITAIRETGAEPSVAFARGLGMNYTELRGFILEETSPLDTRGNLRSAAQTLCNHLGLPADELWDLEVLHPDLARDSTMWQVQEELDKEVDDPETLLMLKQESEVIQSAMKTLYPREREVLQRRNGFADGEGETLKDVALALKISVERIRQIEAKALRKLRHPSRAKALGEVSMQDFGREETKKQPLPEGVEAKQHNDRDISEKVIGYVREGLALPLERTIGFETHVPEVWELELHLREHYHDAKFLQDFSGSPTIFKFIRNMTWRLCVSQEWQGPDAERARVALASVGYLRSAQIVKLFSEAPGYPAFREAVKPMNAVEESRQRRIGM